MANTLCKQILVHAGFSIENWGIPGTPEFAENKGLYNQWLSLLHHYGSQDGDEKCIT